MSNEREKEVRVDSILSKFCSKQTNRSVEHRPVSRLWRWVLGMLSITLVTTIWGYSNVVIRQGETSISPSILLWMRFNIAGIVMLPFVMGSRLSLRNGLIGLGTGTLFGLAVLSQGFAMLTVPVDEVAFITALYVVFTPLGMAVLQRRMPSKLVWYAVCFSLIGVTLLIGKIAFNIHIGILWSLIASLAATGQIIATTSLAKTVSSVQLAGLQSVGAGILMTVAVAVQGALHHQIYTDMFHWPKTEWIWIGYLSIFGTVIAVFLQSWGQARITATEAALAFNLEPVWTVVFALAILSQGMTVVQMIGAALIISSLTLVSQPKPKKLTDLTAIT